MSKHSAEMAVPRVGFEKRWADLANEFNLPVEQKAKMETFMSDLTDAASNAGAAIEFESHSVFR